MERKSASALVCPECGGEFTLSDFMDGDDYVTCTNCNKKYFKDDILHKSTEERIEEIRNKTYSNVESERTRAYANVEEGKRKVESQKIAYKKYKEESKRKSERTTWIVLICMMVVPLAIALFMGAMEEGWFDSNPDAIKVGISSDDIKGQYYSDIVEVLEGKGFKNIEAREDGWHLFKDSGTIKSITIDGDDDFSSSTKFDKNAKVVILYYK